MFRKKCVALHVTKFETKNGFSYWTMSDGVVFYTDLPILLALAGKANIRRLSDNKSLRDLFKEEIENLKWYQSSDTYTYAEAVQDAMSYHRKLLNESERLETNQRAKDAYYE